jgi:hypothetical protein
MDDVEVYVLLDVRSCAVAGDFLDEYLPYRESTANNFPFPEFVNEPETVFTSPDDLMRHLENNPQRSYSLYWNASKPGRVSQAMIFYTIDGAMILGIAGRFDVPQAVLQQLAQTYGAKYGYLTSEECPPSTKSEFMRISTESTLPSLVNGHFHVA